MVLGFLLLAMVSASLAALFVREEELPLHEEESSKEQEMLDALHRLELRLEAMETQLQGRGGHPS
ncbi:hypothetical protein ACS3YM_06270 [Nocardia sp. N13]|uniref:hypothetical protein n=1 Tax=Nocardioides sp. N13(2025) TaxID=3453405 RepID=UPI003F75E7E9